MWVIALAVLAVLLVGLFMIRSGRQDLARKKRVMETPTTLVANVAEGLVEVAGRAESDLAERSPFAQLPCVFCRWKVEEYRSTGKSGYWATVLEGRLGGKLRIRDDSGSAVLDLSGDSQPHYYLKAGNTTRSGMLHDAPPHVEAFLKEHRKSSVGMIFNRSMRYSEEVIAPGEEIYALGHAVKRGDEVHFMPGDSPQTELILSNLSEKELESTLGSSGWSTLMFGTVFLVAPFIVAGVYLFLRR